MEYDSAVAACVNALKDAYVRLRSRYRPDVLSVSSEYDEKFTRVAEELLEAGASPYAYVKYVFEQICKNYPDVYPNMVTSLKLVNRFMGTLGARQAKIREIVRSQAELVKYQLDSGRDLREVLLDPHLEVNAAFRYALACSVNYDDVAARFKQQAEDLMLFEPRYRAELQKWLPEKQGG